MELTVQDRRKQKVRADQIRLLFANASVGIGVTACVAPVLSYLQWSVISHLTIVAWLLYMLLISSARFTLGRRYWRASPSGEKAGWWGAAFTVGAGLSAIGWGAAGVLLYPETHLTNQVFLAFVLGGMMLGAASLLSARPEAFLAFLIPTGLPATARFLLQRDDVHVAMGLLAAIFTIATLITTWHIYQTVTWSINLRFENRELVEELQVAREQTEKLNQELERRVNERTAELQWTNERLRDEIDQRRQMEDELLRARKLESLGLLAGGIAHDFNNFLTIIQVNIDLVRMELESGNPVFDILDRTAGACLRAASLASQLLTFGKGGAPVRRTVSVARLVRDAVDVARVGAQVSLDVAIADDLWFAELDVSQVSHALHNILLNARQAMPEGGTIEVRAENVVLDGDSLPLSAGRYIGISVKDHGCGIPPEILPRIFDPYFTTKKTGTGLGLATAYGIAAKHQGHITVQSTVGAETTFSMYLPACERSLPFAPPAGEALQRGSGRILVMDDEDALRKVFALMLERLGYEAECARDGTEAIALYERAKASGRGFDAVVLDLTVPGGLGGMETAARLKEIDPAVKLIVSSGYSDAPVMSEFNRYGFDGVIPKPWTPAQASEVFKRVLAANPERMRS